MKKNALVCALLALSFLSAGCDKQTQEGNSQSQVNSSSAGEAAKAEKIEVIDFHGTQRCNSCQTIEKYARETLEEYFKKELLDGKITFQSINGELSRNQAMVVKYQARGSSLFLNAVRNGKDSIEEDTMVWRLVGDEQKFKTYFKDKIDSLLN